MDQQLAGTQANPVVVSMPYASKDPAFAGSKAAMWVIVQAAIAGAPSKTKITQEVLDDLRSGGGVYRMNNHSIYSAKKIAKTTVRMFESGDENTVALSNITKGVLEKDQFFCVTGIQLLYATTPGGTPEEAQSALFNTIEDKGVLVNGEHTLKSAKNHNIIEEMPNELFVTPNGGTFRRGMYQLETPRLIEPQKEIVFDVELPSLTGIDSAKDFLKVYLYGVAVMTA